MPPVFNVERGTDAYSDIYWGGDMCVFHFPEERMWAYPNLDRIENVYDLIDPNDLYLYTKNPHTYNRFTHRTKRSHPNHPEGSYLEHGYYDCTEVRIIRPDWGYLETILLTMKFPWWDDD